jgi:Tat protein translocase TatB subunit
MVGTKFSACPPVQGSIGEKGHIPQAMLSFPHLVVLFVIALVVFGPEKLPELARMLGKATAEMRKMTSDFRFALEDEIRDLDRQARVSEEDKAFRNLHPEVGTIHSDTVPPAPAEAAAPSVVEPPVEFSTYTPPDQAQSNHTQIDNPHVVKTPDEKAADDASGV